MAYNGSGTYSLYTPGNPVVSGTTIDTSWGNNTMNDIATALTSVIVKDGQTTTTASIPFVLGIAVTTGITTPSTTFALVNTTATTVNFAGGATAAINVGGAGNTTTWTATSFVHSGTLTVSGTGTSTISGPLAISGASAGQITFPAAQNASANVNTLDDYEEGTFTPGVSFGGGTTGITYIAQTGQYTKIGNRVFFTLRCDLSNKGSSVGTALITGLPFTAVNDTTNRAGCGVVADSLAAGAVAQIMVAVTPNATTIDLYRYSAGALSGLDDTLFTNTTLLRIGGQYIV